MQYMNPLVPEDLDALNELAKVTWCWDIHYWAERGLDHGSFYMYFLNPKTHIYERVNGLTITETVQNAFLIINPISSPVLQIPEFP